MNNFISKLNEYGANTKDALERFVDDEDLYKDCVVLFSDDEAFAMLGQALENQNYSAAFDCAHTLKGVAANLGLDPLLKAVCEIVEPLRHGDFEGLAEKYEAVAFERAKVQELVKDK